MSCIFVFQCSADKFACFVRENADENSTGEPAEAYVHLGYLDGVGAYSTLDFNEEVQREDTEKIIEIAKVLEKEFAKSYDRTKKLLETINTKFWKNQTSP